MLWSSNKWNKSGPNIVQSKREQHPCNEFFSPPWRPSFAANCRRPCVCPESWAACPGSFGEGALVAFQGLDARRPVGHQPWVGTWERSESLSQAKKKTVHLMRIMRVTWWKVRGVGSLRPLFSPGRADQRLHLFHEVAAHHVLVAGDPQRVRHDLGVKSGVQYHDGSVHATVQEVFGKLLQGKKGKKAKRWHLERSRSAWADL